MTTVKKFAGGRLNEGQTFMHYDVGVTVYSTSVRAQVISFIYFKNGKRWVKFPSLAPQTHIFVVGRLCGFTSNSNINNLAVMVNDVFSLPTSPRTGPAPPDSVLSPDRIGTW
jgi:hypothetical protein